jgi:uncharacterized protein (TIGR03437 family)
VTWDGLQAPLFYVSPSQINLQVPSQKDKNRGAGIVVSTAAGSSAAYDPQTATPNTWEVGGLFSANATGCGQAAALNVAADGSLSMNSASNSAAPGGYVSLYATGGQLDPWPDTVAAPTSPPLWTLPGMDFLFDFAAFPNGGVPSTWSGRAPQLVGVSQFNVQLPVTLREGCAVPIQAEYNDGARAMTQPLTVAVRKGGGPCVDPPAAGLGQITFQKVVSTTGVSDVAESDTVAVSLQSSPAKQAPAAPVYSDGCPPPNHVCSSGLPSSTTLFGPSCSVPGYGSLNAGMVSAQGPNLNPTPIPLSPFQEGQLGGLSAYQATLPAGTIRQGQYIVSASGGGDVGAFQSAVPIGADIQIQTPLEAYIVFSQCNPLTINWTGGDPNSWVTLRLIQQAPGSAGGYQFVNWSFRTRTSNGTLTFRPPVPPANACGAAAGTPTPIVVEIEVDPDPSEIVAFSAPGLSLGGQASWRYIHRFQASLQLD